MVKALLQSDMVTSGRELGGPKWRKGGNLYIPSKKVKDGLQREHEEALQIAINFFCHYPDVDQHGLPSQQA